MNVGILGLGQVGKAIRKVVAERYPVYGRDLTFDEIGDREIDTLHVCIPYTDSFVKTIIFTAKSLKPRLIIINSTVKIGTTREISNKVKSLVAHSPVRGIHPDLYKGIKTFVKIIGAVDPVSLVEADKHFRELGLETFGCLKPEATELGKLLSTAYYAWNIVFQKEIYKVCEELVVDPDVAYRFFNLTYNDGYKKLGMPHVIRPVLKQVDGAIGGSCLIKNCQVLELTNKNPVSQFILERNKTY